jgi:choline dehydrogenase-like flavoprotein
MKSDAEVCGVVPAARHDKVELATNTLATRLVTNASGTRVEGVEVQHRGGETRLVRAPVVIVSCGAVNSAALLLRSATPAHPQGLANSSGLVGRRYMAHLATMMQGFHPFRVNTDVFQKTVAINDFYLGGAGHEFPLGQIQSQGRTHGVMAQIVVPWIPLWAYDAWVARGVDWLVMSEDLPDPDNRVTIDPDGRIRLAYRPNNEAAHNELVQRFTRGAEAARFLEGDDPFAPDAEHDAPVRHARVRHRSAHVGARYLLPDPRCREPLRRGRVVLPLVGGREPGPDDRGAGAAGGGPHREKAL